MKAYRIRSHLSDFVWGGIAFLLGHVSLLLLVNLMGYKLCLV